MKNIHLFIYLFIHLFIYSFIYSFIYLFIYSFIYLFIHLFIYLFLLQTGNSILSEFLEFLKSGSKCLSTNQVVGGLSVIKSINSFQDNYKCF